MALRANVSGGPAVARRADAKRNYDRIIDSARDAFADDGLDASLDDIARRAGVGNATLYRHFPTRHALLEAVHREQVSSLCQLASGFAADAEPADALELWLCAVIDSASVSRGLAAALMLASEADEPILDWCRNAIFDAADLLLTAAQSAGAAPTDLSVGQLLKLVNAISLTTTQEHDPQAEARQLLAVVVAGLRSRAGAPTTDDSLSSRRLKGRR